MAESPERLPSQDEALELHRRLLAGDPVATSQLAETFLAPLAAWLRANNPKLDPDYCAIAAEDAIINLNKNPRSYQPGSKTVWGYLRMSAKGDLLNLLQKEKRHRAHATLEDVEQSPDGGKYLTDRGGAPDERAEQNEELARLGQQEAAFRQDLSGVDARVWELLKQGEKRTAVFARVMGINHLSTAEQKKEVKRAKDRVKQRLKRLGGSRGG